MDKADDARRLRDEYEASMDAAESKRAAFHDSVRKLFMSGMPLREIAQHLGVSHQRVSQIVGREPAKRRKRRLAAGGSAAALVLVLGIVWSVAHHGTLDSQVRGFASARTERITRGWNSDNYRLFASDFNGTMRRTLDASAFVRVRGTSYPAIGRYRSGRVLRIEPEGGYVSVIYDARFSRDRYVTMRVVFERSRAHHVAGFWLDSVRLRSCTSCLAG